MNLGAVSPVTGLPTDQRPPENLEGACRALEKVFAQMVFQKMREAMVPVSSAGTNAFARSTTEGLLDAQWAELASRGEGLGLWRALYRQLDTGAETVKSPGAKADEKTRETIHRKEAGP